MECLGSEHPNWQPRLSIAEPLESLLGAPCQVRDNSQDASLQLIIVFTYGSISQKERKLRCLVNDNGKTSEKVGFS